MLPGNRCKECRVKFTPEELEKKRFLHDHCMQPYADRFAANRAKEHAKKARLQRVEEGKKDRAKRAALKTIPELLKEAQREFNAFIRERDRERLCICCQQPFGVGDGGTGGLFDCGHYRSVGSAPHLRFNEDNAHGQRKVCNRWGAGRAVDYRLGLIERIGLARVEALESDNRIHRWTREELIEIRDRYRRLARELKAKREAACQ